MHSSVVCIHAQPDLLDKVKQLGYDWSYSKDFGLDEIDVYVDDVPYEIFDGTYQDPDEQLCEHYEIDYSLVNCIEAVYG